ncbi:MAG: type II secretion system F family protein [Candidatus Omnitrophota bacterium]
MALYNYTGLDSKGKSVKGEIEARNELDVYTQLTQIGCTPVSITLKSKGGLSLTKLLSSPKQKKVTSRSIIIFTRQFSTIVKAAVPIVEGLGVLAEQSDDPVLKEALRKILHDIQEGKRLSEAMARHPGVFNELYVNTVVAGESGGVLDKVLLRLADVLEEEQETRESISSAFRYPIMVIVAMFVAVIVLSTKVIPAFVTLYEGKGPGLPFPTKVMLVIGNSLKNYWFITLPAIAIVFFLIKAYINTPQGRLLWDGMKFKMKIIGPVYNKIVMLRFSSMLNVLYQAGLPILKIMDIVKITIGNVVLAQEIDNIKRDVADGKGVSGGILGSKIFPRLVGYMISIGEKTGSLSMMLDSLYDYYSSEVRASLKTLTSLIEPIMTLVLGAVVAFMAISIFMPMWSLIGAFKK